MPLRRSYRTPASFVGALFLAALLVVPSFWTFAQVKEAARSRQHVSEEIIRAEALLSGLSDAETSQRGFLLTGNETFLAPYLALRDGLQAQLGALREQTPLADARDHLDAMAPLIDAKLAEMANVIRLYRHHDPAAMLAAVRSGKGKVLMEAIRAEMDAFVQIEKGQLAQNEAAFQSRMGNLLVFIVIISLFTLAVALLFIYAIRRETQQRLQNLVHLETKHLLGVQEETTNQLQQTIMTLQESQEKLAVTLNSIGDAVIATDAEARVRLMNPVAEQLTGWTLADAAGLAVDEVFHIINQETRQLAIAPVMETLTQGTVQGLANHTVLIARDGSEHAIADSCAPMRPRSAGGGCRPGVPGCHRGLCRAAVPAGQLRPDPDGAQYRGGRHHHHPGPRWHYRDRESSRRTDVRLPRGRTHRPELQCADPGAGSGPD